MEKVTLRRALTVGVGLLQLGLTAPAAEAAEQGASFGIPTSMRMSPSQYRAAVADLFGPAIKITGTVRADRVHSRTTRAGLSSANRFSTNRDRRLRSC